MSFFANPQGTTNPSRIGLGLLGFDVVGTWLTTDRWPIDVAGSLNAAPFRSVWLFDRAAEHGTFATLGNVFFSQTPVQTPEPSTVGLLGLGLAAAGARRWRPRK